MKLGWVFDLLKVAQMPWKVEVITCFGIHPASLKTSASKDPFLISPTLSLQDNLKLLEEQVKLHYNPFSLLPCSGTLFAPQLPAVLRGLAFHAFTQPFLQQLCWKLPEAYLKKCTLFFSSMCILYASLTHQKQTLLGSNRFSLNSEICYNLG